MANGTIITHYTRPRPASNPGNGKAAKSRPQIATTTQQANTPVKAAVDRLRPRLAPMDLIGINREVGFMLLIGGRREFGFGLFRGTVFQRIFSVGILRLMRGDRYFLPFPAAHPAAGGSVFRRDVDSSLWRIYPAAGVIFQLTSTIIRLFSISRN